MGVIIKSFGHFIPEMRVTNAELIKRFGITEESILHKTGIAERRYYPGGATSDMIIHAASGCLQQAKVSPKDIDCIIVATLTPDYHCPSTASIVHHELGTGNAAGFDLVAACSGYVYALQVGTALINSGAYKNILVCAGEKFSSVVDPTDRKTVLVCADGAGVSLLQYSAESNDVIDIICKLDSTYHMDVNIMVGGSKAPINNESITDENRFMRFSNRRIFDNGVELFGKVILEIAEKNKISFDDIDYIIPHQANGKMIEALASFLNQPIEKFVVNIEHIGNTGAATIPIAISEALETKKLKKNHKLLLASIGAGFTYAAGIITLNHIAVKE